MYTYTFFLGSNKFEKGGSNTVKQIGILNFHF